MLDARGIPTRECPSCGSDLFTIQARFDEDYEICMYLLDCECSSCKTKLTAPTPLDLVEFE
jgi:C4-type Zn-finger protein